MTAITDPIPKDLRSHLETTYSLTPRDELERIIDDFISVTERGSDGRTTLHQILEMSARIIFRRFGFGEVSVGLKSRKDGLYRYEFTLGLRKDVELSFKQATYDKDDMVSHDRFPFIRTGRLSELDPIEGLPEKEREMFNRPFSLESPRRSRDDFHEGDYFDVWMMDGNKGIIGWFELSSPKDGKMPPRVSIRWIEVLASICASIILERWSEEDLAQPNAQAKR